MRIEQLEYFLHVANYGSLSLTANKINVGQQPFPQPLPDWKKKWDAHFFAVHAVEWI